MTFIVADGTNSNAANSYVSIEEADAYHSDRDNALWAAQTEPKKQAALIKATDFVEQVFSSSWPGSSDSTGLSWPRLDTDFGDTEIPARLKKAVCELALQSLTVPLFAPVSREPQLKKKKIDVIEKEWFESSKAGNAVNLSALSYLKPLFAGTNFNNGLNRKVIRV